MLTKDDIERFERAKNRMRAKVGERVFSCWFTALQANDLRVRKRTGKSLLLSVPTASPRHSILTHYMHAVETACMEEWPDLDHISIVVRVLGQDPLWDAEQQTSSLTTSTRSSDVLVDDIDERLKAYAPVN